MWQFTEKVMKTLIFTTMLAFISIHESAAGKNVITLTETTWEDMLEDEWLVEFYAPWCPACQAMETTWKQVATWQNDLNIKVAKIDVSEHASLSGRFLVTALPTLYHVKDGEFRQYKGLRDENSIVSFVDDKKWQEVSPVPWYFSPKSPPMAIMGWFFKISLAIRDVHNQMTSEYGIPVWGSYIIFALLTIIVGLILGLSIVCCCDYCFPPRPLPSEPTRYTAAHPDGQYRVGRRTDHDEQQGDAEPFPSTAPAASATSSTAGSTVRQRPPKAD